MRDILDLDRYPVDQPGTPAYDALVAACKAELAAEGMFSLHDFMHADVAAKVVEQTAQDMATKSFHHAREHNIYFLKNIPGLDPDHPALIRFETSNYTLTGDQVEDTDVTKVYEFEPLRRFLSEVMDKDELFLMDDAMSRLNVMSYGQDDALNWHFDRSEFTVTLLLQKPDQGGEFEYRTDLRTADDPNYDGVAKLLTGQDPDIKRMSLSPGTLNVFRGVNTPHRVVPVEGDKRRVIAVLGYYENPGVRFSDEERIGFYGRAK
jgi:bacterioferritin (cytochrome b1)